MEKTPEEIIKALLELSYSLDLRSKFNKFEAQEDAEKFLSALSKGKKETQIKGKLEKV